MRKYTIPGRNAVLILLVMMIGSGFTWGFPDRAHASPSKNFYFPKVRIEVNIDRDGSFTVDEFRTYDFEGEFSWASLWIPLSIQRQDYQYHASLTDFIIRDEQGKALPAETASHADRFDAKWYYQARNERRTFQIHYRIQGGIVSYPEVSELYWQIIGSGWDRPVADVQIQVYLPEEVDSKNDILVYGHGPLSGYASIVDLRSTRFTVSNLPAYQFVEIRMVWPAGIVRGVPSEKHTRASIQREEANFVQETIARAERAREARERQRRLFLTILKAWIVSLLAVPLLWLLFYVHHWKKVGKDYQFMDIPEYMRELPSDLSPALVEILLREGRDVTGYKYS